MSLIFGSGIDLSKFSLHHCQMYCIHVCVAAWRHTSLSQIYTISAKYIVLVKMTGFRELKYVLFCISKRIKFITVYSLVIPKHI